MAQRFAVQIETVDEHALGAEVCGERVAVGGIGKNTVGVRRFLALGVRSFSRVLNHGRGRRECTIRLDRQQRDAAPGVVGDEKGAATPVHAHVAGFATSRRLLVQPSEHAGSSLYRKGAHHAGLLELLHRIEHALVRVDCQEGRVCAGVYRADSEQLPGAPVHADQIDALRSGAFGIRPNVEEIGIRRRLSHCGARTAFPGATPSTACPFATTDTPFTITCWMPTGESDGSRYVDRSSTVSGSKIVMSASAPTHRRPFSRIAGTLAPSRCAGISVILRMASINESAWVSRT